jgi:predicted AAA+ superfamily ATPase
MKRYYDSVIQRELASNRQMIFLSGPRQVGKTTFAKKILSDEHKEQHYLNWDDVNHRELILAGSNTIIQTLSLNQLSDKKNIIVFDELHKYKNWKNFLKGFFDRFESELSILVTGSARMDIFKRGGDSLMGRYFNYRLHPLSVKELIGHIDSEKLIQSPQIINDELFSQLLHFGGFPEPFLKQDIRFFNRWQKLRQEQLVREDIRDNSNVHELAQMEVLVKLLAKQAGQVTKYSSLAKQIRVSVDTVRRWLDILESFYYCFRVRPWYTNIANSLRKEPKTYLWDWSTISSDGEKNENFIASHLLKACHWWTDLGVGQYELFYLRTKDQKEVDFLICKDNKPWFLVEVKTSMSSQLSTNLAWFQKKTGAAHAFQVIMDVEYIDTDVFSKKNPLKVPAKTFLSQLI